MKYLLFFFMCTAGLVHAVDKITYSSVFQGTKQYRRTTRVKKRKGQVYMTRNQRMQLGNTMVSQY